MNILVRADASTNIGSGHIMRCMALAQACQEMGGKVRFACADIPPALSIRLRSEGIDLMTIDHLAAGAEDMEQTVALAKEIRADWIVLDGYQFKEDFQQAMRQERFRLLCIDDYGHAGQYTCDLLLNQNIFADQIPYERRMETSMLLGTRYALLRREFWPFRGRQRLFTPLVKNILVTMGGSDPSNVTLNIIKVLAGMDNAQFYVRIVVGHGNPFLPVLEEAVVHAPCTMRLMKDQEDMAKLMSCADIAISSGGSTCWELLFMGLPSVLIALAANQDSNVTGLEKVGAAMKCNVPWHGDNTLRTALDVITNDAQKRQSIGEMGYDVVDGYGAERVLAAMAMQG